MICDMYVKVQRPGARQRIEIDIEILHEEVDHLDEAVKSLNRAANRLSLSIIVASMILGSKLVVDSLGKNERRSNRKHRR